VSRAGARAAAVGALVVVAALATWLLLRGATRTSYTLVFENAGQLVEGDRVRIGGRPVGSVEDIALTDDNQAAVRIAVERPYAPLREGTRAVIRLTSLSGVANRYVALSPASGTRRALPDGATLGATATTTPVDLDQLFDTLDPRTRRHLRGTLRAFAAQYRGRAAQAGRAAEQLSPLLVSGRRLAGQLAGDEGALTRFVVSSSRAAGALAERRADLSALVGNANAAAGAIAAEDRALAGALRLLPTSLRRANSTFVDLRSTLDALDPLVAAAKPATRRLAPLLRELRPLLAQARPTVASLATLVDRPGAANDLVDATRRLPRLATAADPAFRSSREALRDSQEVLEFARPYTPELVGWFRDFGAGSANYDANGHFARVQPLFDAFTLTGAGAAGGGVLSPVPPSQRFRGLSTGNLRRCPGAASQPAPDGSSPWRDTRGSLDCDPRQVPPGP
jgi:phospholipid/cholesterol/gamma-HCH transport system substrate-binding protein